MLTHLFVCRFVFETEYAHVLVTATPDAVIVNVLCTRVQVCVYMFTFTHV